MRASWAALLALLVLPACAQDGNPGMMVAEARVPAAPVYRATACEVRLTLTATDARGRAVLDLSPAEVEIEEDGRPVTELTAFRRIAEQPLELAVMVDASASVEKSLPGEVAALEAFVRQVMRPGDAASVISFDRQVRRELAMTGDLDDVQRSLRAVRTGEGGTRLYDAIVRASEELERGAGTSQRAIVLVSDGEDTLSAADFRMAVTAAQHAGVAIYSIAPVPIQEVGELVLRKLSEATGGRYFATRKKKDMAKAFAEIESELRTQYLVTFRPQGPAMDGSYHRLQARASRNEVTLRTRSGYFVPKGRD